MPASGSTNCGPATLLSTTEAPDGKENGEVVDVAEVADVDKDEGRNWDGSGGGGEGKANDGSELLLTVAAAGGEGEQDGGKEELEESEGASV